LVRRQIPGVAAERAHELVVALRPPLRLVVDDAGGLLLLCLLGVVLLRVAHAAASVDVVSPLDSRGGSSSTTSTPRARASFCAFSVGSPNESRGSVVPARYLAIRRGLMPVRTYIASLPIRCSRMRARRRTANGRMLPSGVLGIFTAS